MGLLQNIAKKLTGGSEESSEFKARLKEAQMQEKINRTVAERQLSSNERELRRYVKEQRERAMEEELKKIHKQQTKDFLTGNSILRGGASILHTDEYKNISILQSNKNFMDNGLLKEQKNLFFN